ncbi:DUF3426 domain-containing protein [Pseudomonas sp. 5P_3.1_Bac2]|uniref:DUF3426 domain-containing protein n=1 Tax=Pseudomonas sp. 5P_3.1_Bac2 TaxID=2971617 RepID=UPI0021C6AF0D|nr:DUF3426 domain-containing protein [Pseudomonas sp. 5P_3.1_Bac2]MCU1718246.1 zinc-ribbon domain-containing protein [Pseudomonas sp. 5P_3.1_Bac2]
MTQSFVTQCPHCRTSFRVSLTQLNAAHGAVRCGACLHVFNAAQQLRQQGQSVPGPTAAPSPAASPAKPVATAPAPTPAPAAPSAALTPAASHKLAGKSNDTLWIHDDLDLDNLDLDEELAKLDAQEQLRSQPAATAAQPPRATPANPVTSTTPSAPTPVAAEIAPPHEAATVPAEPNPRAAEETASEPSFSALEPLNELDRPEPPLSSTEPLEEEAAQPLAAEADHTAAEPADVSRDEPKLSGDYRLELHDEPLQLDWQPAKSNWPRRLGWISLNLLAALALGGQYLWYHFDELARQDQYRPWFEQLCPSLGCTLPSKVDISQIKSSNLVVRSHPEFSGALVVDAILYNRAPFSQPFPLLEMRFADINGQLLASRRFKPGEYLAGELAGNKEMPPQTPIHISLDILDPGTQAVNYSLSFHSPE